MDIQPKQLLLDDYDDFDDFFDDDNIFNDTNEEENITETRPDFIVTHMTTDDDSTLTVWTLTSTSLLVWVLLSMNCKQN